MGSLRIGMNGKLNQTEYDRGARGREMIILTIVMIRPVNRTVSIERWKIPPSQKASSFSYYFEN